MDQTHSWHPGAVCLTPAWAIHVDLAPDELLSSWLVRIALANGCDPLSLTGVIWPEYRAWTVDIDRCLPSEQLLVLARMANISSEALELSTLPPIARRITEKIPPAQGHWSWIVSAIPRNRRRLGGLQFCPLCLASDTRPYFRLQWRFAWHTCCERHGCLLLDRCPHCQSPIAAHMNSADAKGIAYCATCKGCLAGDYAHESAGASSTWLQMTSDKALVRGSIEYLGELMNAREWFSCLGVWLGLVRTAARGRSDGALQLMQSLNVIVPQVTEAKAFDCLGTVQRAALLEIVGKLAWMDFDSLVGSFVEAGLSRQCVFQYGVPDIHGLRLVATSLLNRPLPNGRSKHTHDRNSIQLPKTRKEVRRRMDALQRLVESLREVTK